ncbi:DNA-3-methyladenine glycosylase I [Pelagivirga sediminicola]|uniref:DNA-3-methyladenine glycosylase I n=1 Tax=Pelagivirga sediminicola TaxID=2170575 RepID=A0A2T7G9U9_9RHOB|nr:DNA-3-methyladenine glycosylase I [Pelagivirga sediminicola]PVA11176.1 DNA-3-methyladenine glycosylase I [Pelagivirga sediminicola]
MQMTERCGWVGQEEIYIAYHDTEWGVPERDSRALWEKLILDGFQAGLSWITILKKRDNFRAAFQGFDPDIIATWGEADVQRLLSDKGIVRHRGKTEGTIANARAWQKVETEMGFDRYLWDRVGGAPVQNRWDCLADVPAYTPLSTEISKDMKKRGFKFCGPTIVYAFMQACGLVNDHVTSCPRHAAVADMGRSPRPRAP